MKFNDQNEYYFVRGWFENNRGMHDGKFYGAVATQEDIMNPFRAVLDGDDAKLASSAASKQPAVVYPQELHESYDAGGLNPREKQDTSHMLLDQPEWLDKARSWSSRLSGNVQLYRNGNKLFVSFCDGEGNVDKLVGDLQSLAPGAEIDYDYESKPDGEGWQLVSEMVGSGAVAIGVQSPTNVQKFGMSDRGGHGHVDNMGPKKVKPGRNIKGRERNRLRGIGSKSSMPAISQAGSRRGGNQ